ncbi:MAG: NAD(P)/FAD-dependent oxidoreductase [Pseudomonadota bacterium]
MNSNSDTLDVLVIGAGLSGLATAYSLSKSGKSLLILEARAEAGGRIRSFKNQDGAPIADLGPSWVWPEFQPTIASWLSELDLSVEPQFTNGNAILDHGPGMNAQIGHFPDQQGNMVVEGRTIRLVTSILEKLPDTEIQYNSTVKSIEFLTSQKQIRTTTESGDAIIAKKVVVALPPRIALETIEWLPELPAKLVHDMKDTPTWMAPHAKVALVFEHPFWRERGLSGRILSRAGPIVEAHDHCSNDLSLAALWGFIGWPADVRQQHKHDLEDQIILQLKRCFGETAPMPHTIQIEDWSLDSFVATGEDIISTAGHPSIRPHSLRENYYEGHLVFAGSETAERSPGLIEGALDAAERAAKQMQSSLPLK